MKSVWYLLDPFRNGMFPVLICGECDVLTLTNEDKENNPSSTTTTAETKVKRDSITLFAITTQCS